MSEKACGLSSSNCIRTIPTSKCQARMIAWKICVGHSRLRADSAGITCKELTLFNVMSTGHTWVDDRVPCLCFVLMRASEQSRHGLSYTQRIGASTTCSPLSRVTISSFAKWLKCARTSTRQALVSLQILNRRECKPKFLRGDVNHLA